MKVPSPCFPCELICGHCDLRFYCLIMSVLEFVAGVPPILLFVEWFHEGPSYMFEVNSPHTNGSEMFKPNSEEFADQFKNVVGSAVAADYADQISSIKSTLFLVGVTGCGSGVALFCGIILECMTGFLTMIACWINAGGVVVSVILTYVTIDKFTTTTNDLAGRYPAFVRAIQRIPSNTAANDEIVKTFTDRKDNLIMISSAILISASIVFLYFAVCAFFYGYQAMFVKKPAKVGPGDGAAASGAQSGAGSKAAISGTSAAAGATGAGAGAGAAAVATGTGAGTAASEPISNDTANKLSVSSASKAIDPV